MSLPLKPASQFRPLQMELRLAFISGVFQLVGCLVSVCAGSGSSSTSVRIRSFIFINKDVEAVVRVRGSF